LKREIDTKSDWRLILSIHRWCGRLRGWKFKSRSTKNQYNYSLVINLKEN